MMLTNLISSFIAEKNEKILFLIIFLDYLNHNMFEFNSTFHFQPHKIIVLLGTGTKRLTALWAKQCNYKD